MDYIISFKVPSDRLSLFVDLLTGEGMQLSVKACLIDKASRLRTAGFVFKDERGRYSRVPNVIFDPKAIKRVNQKET